MATAFTIADNPAVVGTIITRDALEFMKENLPVTMKCTRKYEKDLPEHGTVQVIKYGDFTAYEEDVTSGESDLTYTNASTTAIDVELKYKANVPILIKDTITKVTRQDIEEQYGLQGGFELVKLVEERVINTALTDAGTYVGTYGSDIDTDLFQDLKKHFNDQKAPVLMPRHMIVSSKGEQDIIGIDEYRTANTRGNSDVILGGQLSPYLGVQPDMSQLIPASGSGYRGISFITPGIAVVSAPLTPVQAEGVISNTYIDQDTRMAVRFTMQYDIDKSGWKYNLDLFYGVKVLESNWVIEVRH